MELLELPNDVIFSIFLWLTSKERAIICTVNDKFYRMSLMTSCSRWPQYLTNCKNIPLTQQTVSDILKDYHLFVRMKIPATINVEFAKKSGDSDVMSLVLSKTKCRYYHDGFPECKHDQQTKDFSIACYTGCIEMIKYYQPMISRNNDKNNLGLISACYGGQLEAVKYFTDIIPLDRLNLSYAARVCCSVGQLDILKFIYSVQYFDNECIDADITSACKHNQLHVVKYIMDVVLSTNDGIGTRNYGLTKELEFRFGAQGFNAACRNGNLDVVKLLVELGISDIAAGLYTARINNHALVAEYLHSLCSPYDQEYTFIIAEEDKQSCMMDNADISWVGKSLEERINYERYLTYDHLNDPDNYRLISDDGNSW